MVISGTIIKAAIVSLAIVVLVLAYRGRSSSALRALLLIVLAVTASADVAVALHLSVLAVKTPPLWDFICFRVYAMAAAQFHDPYSTHALIAAARGIPTTPSFTSETLVPGMPYPPPSLLLFYPLALGSLHAVALAWWLALLAALALLSVIVARAGFGRFPYALAGAVAVWAFPPMLETLYIGQTMIFATLAAALFLFDKNHLRRGIWLTLGFMAKPVVIVLVLYSIVRRELNTLAAFLVTLAIVSGASLLFMSPGAFASYFVHNPISRVPGSLYRESAYQSLFRFIIHLSGDTSAHYRLYEQYPFLILSVAIIAITLWCCAALSVRERALAVALLICAGLIVYPGTLYFYGTLMLIPMVVCWQMRSELPGGNVTVAVFWAIETGCQALGMHGAFWGFVFGWVFFAGIIASRVLRERVGVTATPLPTTERLVL